MTEIQKTIKKLERLIEESYGKEKHVLHERKILLENYEKQKVLNPTRSESVFRYDVSKHNEELINENFINRISRFGNPFDHTSYSSASLKEDFNLVRKETEFSKNPFQDFILRDNFTVYSLDKLNEEEINELYDHLLEAGVSEIRLTRPKSMLRRGKNKKRSKEKTKADTKKKLIKIKQAVKQGSELDKKKIKKGYEEIIGK